MRRIINSQNLVCGPPVQETPLEASPATVHLGWPAGRGEVAETACLLLVGGVGSRFSSRGCRSRFPDDGGGIVAE